MSVNRYKPHLRVLPEDDANKDIATGFYLGLPPNPPMQVLRVARGWSNVLGSFQADYIPYMGKYPNCYMVLLLDFDARKNWLDRSQSAISPHLTERVFILGALTKPEKLRSAGLGSYETIGRALARDCLEGTREVLGHDLLRHNASEFDRLHSRVWPFLA